MLLTASPKTTLPQHSAGWGVMRLITDRGGKNINESPAVWGKHRVLNTDDRIRRAAHQLQAINTVRQLSKIRETRP